MSMVSATGSYWPAPPLSESRLMENHPDRPVQYGGATTFFVLLYTAVFDATWLTIPAVYPIETFKGNARGGVIGWRIGNGWLMMLSLSCSARSAKSRTFRST
ncbi:hypothetical protein BDZ89DRAFT_1037675 [Hymenopellis radicata]|nr:hypothetical protein BDZ89DRAFT_1037675 [Hymenopellis radicata]